jgi:lipopolysaccharide/colanic/teichoic acid biosynthesis glycosyltransferase
MTIKQASTRDMSKGSQLFLKRLLDVVLAYLGLLVLSPMFIVLPLVIRIHSKGPVFFHRRVVGKDNVPFFALKFRTMVQDADLLLAKNPNLMREFLVRFKLKEDPRITPEGYFMRKYSLDEIPQLINVLQGRMSLVGPRIMTEQELQRRGKQRDRVLSVRPGLTGLWQISGRQDISFEERVKLDIHYVENWSLWGDMIIMLRTLPVVLKGTGAY